MLPGEVPRDWRHRRIAVRATVNDDLPFVDIEAPPTRVYLELQLGVVMSSLGYTELDIHTIMTFGSAHDPLDRTVGLGLHHAKRRTTVFRHPLSLEAVDRMGVLGGVCPHPSCGVRAPTNYTGYGEPADRAGLVQPHLILMNDQQRQELLRSSAEYARARLAFANAIVIAQRAGETDDERTQ